jgi:hypothetical protein
MGFGRDAETSTWFDTYCAAPPPPPPPLPPARLEVGWSSANIIAHALGWPSALASHPFWLLASHLTQ